MVEHLTHVDPEAVRILQEVAADPQSRLLRYVPGSVSRGVLESGGAVSSREAGLSSAERLLVDSYREEVAGLGLRLARASLSKTEVARAWSCELGTGERLVRPQTYDELAAELAALRRESVLGQESHALGDPSADSFASDCIGLAQRLVPSGRSAVYEGLRLLMQSTPYEAGQHLKAAVQRPETQPHRIEAFLALAVSHILRDQREEALMIYTTLHEERPDMPIHITGMMGMGMILGREDVVTQAMEALRRVSCSMDVIDEVISLQERTWHRRRGAGSRDTIHPDLFEKRINDALQEI